jgi:hypothetical protein
VCRYYWVDWHFVDLIAYSVDLHHHYSYPQTIVDGDSILVVCRWGWPFSLTTLTLFCSQNTVQLMTASILVHV